MPRSIFWNFYKLVLRRELSFAQRQAELVKRFQNADTFVWKWRDTQYRFQLFDVGILGEEPKPSAVYGHLCRSPKTARGRALNIAKKSSEEETVNLEEIADATEFIYDLQSCVLALHRRAPFTSVLMVTTAFKSLLGVPADAKQPKVLDIDVEAMRDDEFADQLFDSTESLREVKIVFAKPNPDSGDEILGRVHLGLIGEETNSDEINFDAKKKGDGSISKDREGFVRRSIRFLLNTGYMKNGFVRLGDKRYDLKQAKEKERETTGYQVDEEMEPVDLKANAAYWLEEMTRDNGDIFPES
jgi:hypothetical protein